MKKIVITGGLGYIGSELCKLYSGQSRFKNIVVIDNRFVSERVKQLRDWGIEYVNASIMDADKMKLHLSDADVVIHLAGITDVAYVKTESNKEQDEEIRRIGVLGTRNIINSVKEDCKIIFPSTHVVYEGTKEVRYDISEEEPTCPILTYAVGKVQSEQDLISSGKNYIILRLASVYGYSTDTMRIGIMPNLFSKITSQNGVIKLFSGGVQLKSIVPIFDVVRCIKFMAESRIINKEIFHLSKEAVTVKDVADMCKEINPNLTVIETEDEIPNGGYAISNSKLLGTGFNFLYDIRSCLKEMITNWSKKDINPALEYLDSGGRKHEDSRGIILNYDLTEPINLIGYIESFYGTLRANHYHPIQEQKCLLVKGQYISVIKDLATPGSPIETRLVNEGDIAIIKPNVAHTMIFTKNSIFLNLVRGERNPENYGITHTLPYCLVDENDRKKLLESYRTSCRCCGNLRLDRVISLGNSPLANNLKNSLKDEAETYPLEMNYCSKCHNCQLSVSVPPGKMFDNYLYTSSTTASFRNHFENAAKKYVEEFNLDSASLVVDIGSNDGIALKPLKELGIAVVGVEPAKNIAKIANDNGIETINQYFDQDAVDKILEKYGYASLVTASNVFAHSDHLSDIVKSAFSLLKDDGSFIVEVQYLLDTMIDITFDNIYHEHANYWSVTSLVNFFNRLNKEVYKVEHIKTHGGSIRVYVRTQKVKNTPICSSVEYWMNIEKAYGMCEFKAYKKFAEDVSNVKETVNINIRKLKEKYGNIVAYGSPAKATTSLNYFGINSHLIDYTIEDNEMKHGKWIPGVDIPVKGKNFSASNFPPVILVLAWNFFEQIKSSNKELLDYGTKFVNIHDLYSPDFNVEG